MTEEAGLTAERRVLLHTLTGRYGWPQHEAAQLLHGRKRRR